MAEVAPPEIEFYENEMERKRFSPRNSTEMCGRQHRQTAEQRRPWR